MKIVLSLLLIALLVGSNGCMTSSTVQRARGYTNENVQPLNGDTAFQHDTLTYIIQQKRTEGEANSILVLSPNKLPPPYLAYKPNAAYYLLVPLTVPADIITSPFQLVVYLGLKYGDWHM